ncbi:MAG: methylated-DNA--[protein]-cysteine S-methyltransferase [Bacteroidales bacterium]|nr:methylated-DNA--[protein]-cysteine S-methyltransferase [Bacteroidales bacterium]
MKQPQNIGHAHCEIITLEQMPRTAWMRKKNRLSISHSIIHTQLGKLLVASVGEKICFMGLGENKEDAIRELQQRYPHAELKKETLPSHQNVRKFFLKEWKNIEPIQLYVRGTDFQVKVWQELLNIPVGKISSYGEIARKIGKPRSVRPIGNAVGKNPVLFLIPCHRVICSSGKMGGFAWGIETKLRFLNFESHSGRKIPGYFNWEPTLF